jgi:hypothetical protein
MDEVRIEDGSSRTTAVVTNAPAAITRATRPTRLPTTDHANARQAHTINAIASSTIVAPGLPGTASQLTERATGS